MIECDNCEVRPAACGDCVVTAMLGVSPSQGVHVDERELRALGLLAAAGLIAPLRLSRPGERDDGRHPEKHAS